MESHINKLLEQLAEFHNKDLAKITALFEWTKNALSAETGKTDPALSISAYHAVKAELAKRQATVGKEINVVFFGKDSSQDQNKSYRNEILAKFWNNPETRRQVTEEGKIMVGRIGKSGNFHDDFKPIVSMEESVEIDGEVVPTKFELWDPATNINPLCRDDRTHKDNEGNVENWNHTKPLLENWKTTLFGIGYFEDTPAITKKIQVRFYGNAGNPNAPEYIIKIGDFFRPYKMKVEVNEKLSGEDCYVLNAKSKPVFSGEPGEEIDIVQMMDSLNAVWQEQLRIKGKEPKDLIPIIPLSDLKDWHFNRRAIKDEDGEIIKNDRGYDVTNWDEYCLIDQVTYLGMRDYKDYHPAAITHDSTGQLAFNVNYDDNLSWDIPIPADLLICIKTSRGTSRYDRETKEKIQNAEDPDLTVYIRGYKLLQSFEKIIFPKELIGDL